MRRPASRLIFFSLFVLAAFAVQRPAAAQSRTGQAGGVKDKSVLEDVLVQYQAKRGLDLLYDMQFDQAVKLFDQIDRRYPNHPIGPFLKALNTWWEILLDLSDTSHDEQFFVQMGEVIDRCDAILAKDKHNFDAMFFKGAALGFRGRHRSNRGDWFKAAMDGKRAMDYVLAVAKRDPSNHDYVFGKGIYDYFADVMPKRYPLAKPLMIFFPNGDRERGLALLKRTAEHGTYIQTEAAYFLLQIYYLFEQDYDKSVEYVTWLRREHPDNAFFHTLEGRVYARWGYWDKSTDAFEEVLKRYRAKRPGYNAAAAEQSLYYIARARMANGQFEQAVELLEQLDSVAARIADDTYFKVWGRLRQGMAYDALGNRDMAVARYREVMAMKDLGRVHERAKEYLEEPYDSPGYSAIRSFSVPAGQ